MFDIGWSEFLFLAVLVLIVVGPQELPGLMRRLGQISSAIRNAAFQFQLNLKALDGENSISELQKFADDVSPKNMLNQIQDDISDAITPPEIVDPVVSEKTDESTASNDEGKKDVEAFPSDLIISTAV